MAQSIREQKSLHRQQFKAILSQISPDEVQRQSEKITRKALALTEYKDAKCISIFLSMPGKEISTKDIVLQAFRDDKKVFIPYIHTSKQLEGKTMDMLRLRDQNDLESLQPDAWGIPSLASDSASERENALGGVGCLDDVGNEFKASPTLDLIFLPAMAFDRSNNRLGHGKGFYDRYISQYKALARSSRREREVPHLVGLALREQLLSDDEKLPTTEQDWVVDRVVTAES